jgi:aminopeptidase N
VKKYLLFFVSATLLLRATAQNKNVSISAFDIPAMEQKAHEGIFRSVKSGAANTYDLKYHRCVWTVDPAVRYIEGSITSYFKPTTPGFDKMQFDLDSAFVIDSIKYHSSVLTYTLSNTGILEIDLPSVLPVNTLDSITVTYHGIPGDTGFGSFNQSTHNGTPIIWTLSEPFGAKDWWPCKQDLDDKIDSLDVIVTTTPGNRVASNGLLLSETVSGINKVYHWKTKHLIAAYLIAIAVTNYSSYSDFVPLENDSIEVLNYVYPENLSLAQSQTPDIINIIKFYDSLTITYPFADEKYGHAQFGWGGGMEHQTMSFVTNFTHALIAHECAHQWFGDHVTCGSWQDIWLHEGFATYFEGLTEERFFPETWLDWKQSKITNITSKPNGSVHCDDTTSVERIFDGRLSYNKASYLLHMLRWKLGDSLFFLSLKNYLNDPSLAGGYARTTDLQSHMETTSGQNLTNFFNQWFYGQGYPSYQLSWGQKGSAVSLTVEQSQSDPSVSFFEMPLPVKFIGEYRDTTIVIDHTFSGQNFALNVNFAVTTVVFDPESWILSSGNLVIAEQQNDILVYPNPSADDVSITIQFKDKDEISFEIFNVEGKKISSEKETVDPGIYTKLIETANLSAGVYELRITGTKINYSRKIVKK